MTNSERQQKRLRKAILRAAHTLYPKGEQDKAVLNLLEDSVGPSSVFDVSEEELAGTYGFPAKLAFFYSILPQVSRRLLSERAWQDKMVTSVRRAREHLLPLYLAMPYEYSYILCLTKKGKLLRVTPLRMGTVDEAPFYSRIILEAAYASEGEVFILAHNHPSGIEFPSVSDCQSTLDIMTTMADLDMILIDHLVFAEGNVSSMRDCGTIKPAYWEKYAPLPPAFQNWFK